MTDTPRYVGGFCQDREKCLALKAALTELLRLYDWRNELGRIERDFNHNKKQMKTWLNQYGREKKAAWEVAFKLLRGGETAIRGSQSSQQLLAGETPAPATNKHVATDHCSFDRSSSISEDTYVCNCGWREHG